jgi:hypothetical protein
MADLRRMDDRMREAIGFIEKNREQLSGAKDGINRGIACANKICTEAMDRLAPQYFDDGWAPDVVGLAEMGCYADTWQGVKYTCLGLKRKDGDGMVVRHRLAQVDHQARISVDQFDAEMLAKVEDFMSALSKEIGVPCDILSR